MINLGALALFIGLIVNFGGSSILTGIGGTIGLIIVDAFILFGTRLPASEFSKLSLHENGIVAGTGNDVQTFRKKEILRLDELTSDDVFELEELAQEHEDNRIYNSGRFFLGIEFLRNKELNCYCLSFFNQKKFEEALNACQDWLGPITQQPPIRTWTARTGHKLEARYQSTDNGSVVLKKPDGETVTVPELALSQEDLKWISNYTNSK